MSQRGMLEVITLPHFQTSGPRGGAVLGVPGPHDGAGRGVGVWRGGAGPAVVAAGGRGVGGGRGRLGQTQGQARHRRVHGRAQGAVAAQQRVSGRKICSPFFSNHARKVLLTATFAKMKL